MELNLENVSIVYNQSVDGAFDFAKKAGNAFFEAGLTKNVPEVFDMENMPSNSTFTVTIGGDGTILKCARFYAKLNVPVFGFNMGRLGYLSQALPDEIDFVIKKLRAKDFRIEERLMLKSNMGNVALNDMVIKKELNERTSPLHLFINEEPVCSYMADGLIISTPTGSTAYSLSAGGPVISPDIDCFTVVPICPHTLTARPVVVNSNETFLVKMCENTAYQLTADGQDVKKFQNSVTVQKFEHRAKLLLLNKDRNDFYRVLREKLHWGVAPNKC